MNLYKSKLWVVVITINILLWGDSNKASASQDQFKHRSEIERRYAELNERIIANIFNPSGEHKADDLDWSVERNQQTRLSFDNTLSFKGRVNATDISLAYGCEYDIDIDNQIELSFGFRFGHISLENDPDFKYDLRSGSTKDPKLVENIIQSNEVFLFNHIGGFETRLSLNSLRPVLKKYAQAISECTDAYKSEAWKGNVPKVFQEVFGW